MPEPAAESRARIEARRARLRELMDRLERALAAPVGPDAAGWQDAVSAVVDDMAEELDDHIAETECPGAFFDEILAAAPRLSHRVDTLRAEHPRLVERLHEVRETLGADPTGDDPAAGARNSGVTLLGELARHRQAGADLLYEAYWVDVSTAD